MTKFKQVEDADFHWPEPLVIDVVCERYPDIAAWHERLALARLQARALFESYAGRDRQAAAARLELIAFCAARGLGAERIARVDEAVLGELAQLAMTRFRASPRTRTSILLRLEAVRTRACATPARQPAEARRVATPGLRVAVTG